MGTASDSTPGTTGCSLREHRRALSVPLPGSGPLERRFEIPTNPRENKTTLPWKASGFRPGHILRGSDDTTLPMHDANYHQQSFTASDSGKSADESSVISVYDLGLSSPSASSVCKFSHFAESGRAEADDVGSIKDVDEVRHLLCLKPAQPGSKVNIEKSLRERIEETLVWNEIDESDYLPLNAFEETFGIESIKSLVREMYPGALDAMLHSQITEITGNRAEKSRRRIIAILILMKCPKYIENFIQENIWDCNLPFRQLRGNMKAFTTTNSGFREENTTLFKDWDRNEVHLFYLYQYVVFVPFFDIQENRLCFYAFDRHIKLPWQGYDHKSNGGNGIVHKVQIHPRHHNFQGSQAPGKPLYFALKEIDSLNREPYRQELSALEKSRAQIQREKHLIQLLLTFQHGDKYYLLFEWADGNLEEFWEQTSMTPCPEADKWVTKQFLGISSAIKRIHGLSTWHKQNRELPHIPSGDGGREWGRHGDIKPNNILWFSTYKGERNHLVVSDLGLTRYHTNFTKSHVPNSHIEGCTWPYRPPEMDLGHRISQKYDVWSLGCVYLEFCTWYLEGIDAIHEFESLRSLEDNSGVRNVKEDKYFNIISIDGKECAEVKAIVTGWITRLIKHPSRTEFTTRMLELIRDGMLVTDPRLRWKIDSICAEILTIKSKLEH